MPNFNKKKVSLYFVFIYSFFTLQKTLSKFNTLTMYFDILTFDNAKIYYLELKSKNKLNWLYYYQKFISV